MEKFVEQTFLFDFYGELLTERQRQVYTSVVFEDYSLSEVAEELGISRQGVHDMIRRCNRTLEDRIYYRVGTEMGRADLYLYETGCCIPS